MTILGDMLSGRTGGGFGAGLTNGLAAGLYPYNQQGLRAETIDQMRIRYEQMRPIQPGSDAWVRMAMQAQALKFPRDIERERAQREADEWERFAADQRGAA